MRLRIAGWVLVIGLGWSGAAWAQSDETTQQFFLPGTNTGAFRVHASATTMNLTLAHGNVIAVGGYKVAYTYAHGGRTLVSLSNVDMPIAGTAGANLSAAGVLAQKPPAVGSVIGIAIQSSTALTAGSATCEATILRRAKGAGEVERTGLTVAIGGNTGGFTQYRAASQARALDSFSIEDGIGSQLTTTSDFAPTSAELACTVITEY